MSKRYQRRFHRWWLCDIYTIVVPSASLTQGWKITSTARELNRGIARFPVVTERVPVINSLPQWMDHLRDVFARYFHVFEQTGRTFERPIVSISMLVMSCAISNVLFLYSCPSFYLQIIDNKNLYFYLRMTKDFGIV